MFCFLQEERRSGTCSGIIKRVRLFNFMCHESFDAEWHPNLNFIIGENGSGKSAVLSGILIGLGARANTTSRTKAIKGKYTKHRLSSFSFKYRFTRHFLVGL